MKTTDYAVLRRELRRVMTQVRKWEEMPDLLDQLDRVRRQTLDAPPIPKVESPSLPLWVDRFTEVCILNAGTAIPRQRVERTARTLWHGLPEQDPAAVARGQLDSLPRSYA